MLRSPKVRLWLWLLWALSALLGGVIGLLLPQNIRLENALNTTFARPLDDRIVIVGIDDASLRDYGRLEVWPRELYVSALQILNEAGARAVGLDVLLSAPGQNTPELAAAFSRPNLVLATSPDDVLRPFPSNWQSPTGVSALNAPSASSIREVQTAYPLQGSGRLAPSFARQVAAQLGHPLPLSTQPHLLRYSTPANISQHLLPFRDVVNGNFRYAAVQNKVVLLGLTASSSAGQGLLDIDGQPVAGTVLQAKAVSSLLAPPIHRLPVWLTALLTALLALVAAMSRQFWGFGLALGCLALAALCWPLNISLPAVTLSLGALLGMGAASLESWWGQRRTASQDMLTGFGNRLAFTRLIEDRWQARDERPISLILVDLDHFRRINELHGRSAGDAVLAELARRLVTLRRRGDLVFRWGPDEFAVLLDPMQPRDLHAELDLYRQHLGQFEWQDLTLHANIGAATATRQMLTPAELVEAASRERYRMKYLREQVNDYGLEV